MKILITRTGSMIALACVSLLPQAAHAQKTTFNCSGNIGPCLGITHSGMGPANFAIRAQAHAGAIAAASDGGDVGSYGVFGDSTGGNGVQGRSASVNASGVYGENTQNGFGVAGRSTSGGIAVYADNASNSGWAGFFNGRVNVNQDLFVNGLAHATESTWRTDSDARLKKNIKTLEGALDQLLALRGVTFEWKDPASHGNQQGTQRGFIAQEVEKVFPAWIHTKPDGFKTIGMQGIEAVMVESIRALKTENDRLQARLDRLEHQRSLAKATLSDPLALGVLLLAAIALLWARRRDRRAHP